MTTIQANQFKTREQIENEVRKLAGGSATPKPDFEIQGSKEELELLGLSESSLIFGVRVKIT